jgi:ribosomal-protein-serine acetyltransferase
LRSPRRDQTSLTDNVITIRPVSVEDLTEWQEMILETLTDLRPWMGFVQQTPKTEDTLRWLESQPSSWKEGTNYAFAIQDAHSGALLGSCVLNGVNPSYRMANVVYWVRTSRRGQGIAGRSARLLAEFGFRHLDLLRIEIVVAVENTASRRAAEKAGAKLEGLLRNRIQVGARTYSAAMYSIIPSDLGMGGIEI